MRGNEMSSASSQTKPIVMNRRARLAATRLPSGSMMYEDDEADVHEVVDGDEHDDDVDEVDVEDDVDDE